MDSEAHIVASLRAAISDLDLPHRDDSALKDIIGLGMQEVIDILYPGRDKGFLDDIVQRYRHHFFCADQNPSKLFPGARETLQKLHRQGYMLAIATGKGRYGLDRSLHETGLKSLFLTTRCADETCSKPNPRMLQEIMEQLNVTAEVTLMIGDTEYDMAMANNAGVTPLAVGYGVHESTRLLQYKPLGCLNSIDELPYLLDQESSAI